MSLQNYHGKGPQPLLWAGLRTTCEKITLCVIPNRINNYRHHHHHISFMELGHLLTRSGLTYPEVSSKVYHDSFCQLDSSVSLPWVIYFEAFYLNIVSSFLVSSDVCCLELILVLSSSSSSSSSSYICHAVGPLVDPFRSHVSRSLFKGLP